MKLLLLHYLRYSRYSLFMIMFPLMMIVSFIGPDREKINSHGDYHDEKIARIEKSIQNIETVIKENNTRMIAVNKVSAIILSYNSSLDEKTRQKYANEIYIMTIKYDNLDIDLICATITHESARTWDSTIVSHAGAMGLMQIMPTTGRFLSLQEGIEWTNTKDILFNPIYNIRLGSRYLSTLIHKYSKRMGREFAVEAALAAYNGGEKRVTYWIKKNRKYKYLYKETQMYIPRVLDLYEQFIAINM